MTIPAPQAFSDLSVRSLEEMELAAYARATELRKAVRRDLELCIEQWALAALAKWMREHRDELRLREECDDKTVTDGLLPGDR